MQNGAASSVSYVRWMKRPLSLFSAHNSAQPKNSQTVPVQKTTFMGLVEEFFVGHCELCDRVNHRFQMSYREKNYLNYASRSLWKEQAWKNT